MPHAVAAGSGIRPAKLGAMATASANAKAKRIRGGTTVSPNPGSSMIMAPARANNSAAAQISTP